MSGRMPWMTSWPLPNRSKAGASTAGEKRQLNAPLRRPRSTMVCAMLACSESGICANSPAVFKIFCKCAKRGTQRISRARGLRLRACANAATASAAWPWQVAGEMLKWGTDGRPMKVLIPVTVGTISIAFSRRSVKAGVERTLSLRPRMVNRRSACQDT